MSPPRARFVTACQQLLALAVVLAVLTPAASIVTLDVVGSGAAGSGATLARPTARMAAYTAEAVRQSRVPTAPVKPDVREVQLTAPTTSAGRAVPVASAARMVVSRGGRSRLTTTPQAVTGFGEVGITWAPGIAVPQTALHVAARTRTHGVWTPWSTVPYDPEHGPDPGSAEARRARPGTDPVLVGRVGHVQVRAVSDRPLPADMKLAVISPGRAAGTSSERAAIDTSTMDGNNGSSSVHRTVDRAPAKATDGAPLAAAVFTPQPVIYSRAQWGADEKLRVEVVAALRRRARRLRPPHGERQRLHARRGARDHPQHLRLPREVPWLERHRLQLPHRPVRSHLGGAVRRRRPPRGRSAHPGLQRRLVRRLRDRQLPDREADSGHDPGLCDPLRLEALAARRRRLVHAPVRHLALVPGDQRPPGRGRHRCARGSTSTTSCPRSAGWRHRTSAAGPAGSSSPTSPPPRSPTSSYDVRATARASSSPPAD